MSKTELISKIEEELDIAWNSHVPELRKEAQQEVIYYATKYWELYGEHYIRPINGGCRR